MYHCSCPSDQPFLRESEIRASLFGFHPTVWARGACARRRDSSSDRSKHTISESPPFGAMPRERGLQRSIGRETRDLTFLDTIPEKIRRAARAGPWPCPRLPWCTTTHPPPPVLPSHPMPGGGVARSLPSRCPLAARAARRVVVTGQHWVHGADSGILLWPCGRGDGVAGGWRRRQPQGQGWRGRGEGAGVAVESDGRGRYRGRGRGRAVRTP